MAKAKKLPSGSWRVQVYSHTENGKRIYESFTADEKKEAEYLAAEFARNKQRRSKPADWTVGEAIDKYIASIDGIRSPTTMQGYKAIRKNNLQEFMNVKLKDVTQEKLQEHINQESKKISPRTKKKLSPKTISNIHGLISAALTMYHPSLNIKTSLPAKQKKLIELPTAEEMIDIIIGTNIELPCLLAMWMSYSMSEIRGIKTSAISKDGMISIKEVIVDVNGKAISKNETKAYNRTRKSRLHRYLFDLIKKQESYIAYQNTGIDDYLIKMSRQQIYDRFILLQEKARINPTISFHKLRHLNASVMLMLGVPDKYAMERGGWATDYTMKNVYQHTFSKERQAVDNKIDNYFNEIMQRKMQHE
ncbi:tyrosine-type recombinase/integrase [Anaerovorax sp. IOR16]|uniref:tyrosine-type recombinase/integrase n=1 Tax=Anaerovorax sp. IOR16 TaxID=2773458 RepID=UPI0019D071C0|nr:tyrosine-type recombinase/integrase [Anaerovorax sp. IOR16]